MLLQVYALTLAFSSYALHNVTVDDGNPVIKYFGSWCESAANSLDYGGKHKLTVDPTAFAMVNFTGNAIYYLAPLWPYLVTTAISLDSSPETILNLTDSRPKGDNTLFQTVASTVVWAVSGLDNIEHTLIISPADGDSHAIVDALIYTAVDQIDTVSTSPPPTQITPFVPQSRPTLPTAQSRPSGRLATHDIPPLALAACVSMLGFAALLYRHRYYGM